MPLFPQELAEQPFGRPRVAIAGGVAIVAAYAVVNFAVYPFLDRTSWSLVHPLVYLAAGICLGTIASEIGVLSAALVFGVAPGFALRLMGLWALGLLLFACWAAGVLFAEGFRGRRDWPWEMFYDLALILPLISLAVQAPLWMLKLYFGWRIELANAPVPDSNPKSLSIRDILFGTLVTALAIAAVRFVVSSQSDLDLNFWAAWGIGITFLAGASLLVLAPLMMLILRVDRPAVAFGAAAGYAVTAGIVATITWVAVEPGILKDSDFPTFFTLLISSALTPIAPLGIARWAGYRLRIGQGTATN